MSAPVVTQAERHKFVVMAHDEDDEATRYFGWRRTRIMARWLCWRARRTIEREGVDGWPRPG